MVHLLPQVLYIFGCFYSSVAYYWQNVSMAVAKQSTSVYTNYHYLNPGEVLHSKICSEITKIHEKEARNALFRKAQVFGNLSQDYNDQTPRIVQSLLAKCRAYQVKWHKVIMKLCCIKSHNIAAKSLFYCIATTSTE